ncbi:hypothetical protein LG58_412 [Kosakonia radicincitans YD4]|nr:hypothetical protein LG58_412 [Kosakonia radicincitans YD4]
MQGTRLLGDGYEPQVWLKDFRNLFEFTHFPH